jgi:hypothetical protein
MRAEIPGRIIMILGPVVPTATRNEQTDDRESRRMNADAEDRRCR